MKTVIFDFDGTITETSGNLWKSIWKELDYDISNESYYSSLFNQFITNKISYQEWCDKTCDAFVQRGLNINTFLKLTNDFKLIAGAEETFRILKQNGVSLHILSGNIIQSIKAILGNSCKYFDTISANNFIFNQDGKLSKIEGTKYDFVGKAHYVNYIKEINSLNPEDIYFVGNSINDEWVYLSGCKTICINPDRTDITNSTKWHNVLPKVTNLKQILPLLIEKNVIHTK